MVTEIYLKGGIVYTTKETLASVVSRIESGAIDSDEFVGIELDDGCKAMICAGDVVAVNELKPEAEV